VQQLLWSNPRYVFFGKKSSSDFDAAFGPKGAQASRTRPLDRSGPWQHPYGTPVWLASQARCQPAKNSSPGHRQRLVSAVRADYFAGTGPDANRLAIRRQLSPCGSGLWPK
jgi:membrane-bound lytic murein transglycosylase A